MDTGAAIDDDDIILVAVAIDADTDDTDANADADDTNDDNTGGQGTSPPSSFNRGRKLFEKIFSECCDLKVV